MFTEGEGSTVMVSYATLARQSLEGQGTAGPDAEKKFLVPLWISNQEQEKQG